VIRAWLTILSLYCCGLFANAQDAYFIDGYHGGIYGHLPPWQTRFMTDKLGQYPNWKINLELEPESWDTIEERYPEDFKEFSALFADQSANGRIEYVNPSYGQSYLYNISGESIIRQFYYGIKKLRGHFPGAIFSTYSSEEPCFTSALPQILRSFGFKYASLKNPNTCWGGYTRAYGGELVNWIGPDGSALITVPRYAVESLKPKSTWETIASNNSTDYITQAFAAGIRHPVGMCLQDAGWAAGPWHTAYKPTLYETWRGYIENRSIRQPREDWHFTQEDVLVSLVWGGQILQRIAREVRAAENDILVTEKLAAMARLVTGKPWPALDEAWRTLLLSQHHDCWIVPYNKRFGVSWAENVVKWTGATRGYCDSLREQSMEALSGPASSAWTGIRVFNPTSRTRTECVAIAFPSGKTGTTVLDNRMHPVPIQLTNPGLLFIARVPPLGWATYTVRSGPPAVISGAHVQVQPDGLYRIETDIYRILLNPAKGGAIVSLVAKKLGNKEFSDTSGPKSFGELRGNFYTGTESRICSSTEKPARIGIVENGPLRVILNIEGSIAGTPYTQIMTVVQGQRRIDFQLGIDWGANRGIGDAGASRDPLRKPFYIDTAKLQALFPLQLSAQKVYKDAPFDVLQSKLPDTFFDRWDSIKNVVLFNWVDVTDGAGKYGMALLSDHTTSYAHGPHYPLGLTLQYSGPGLFGRDYSLQGSSEIRYALIPHVGTWDKAGVWAETTEWNEPLQVGLTDSVMAPSERSMVQPPPSWETTSMTFDGDDAYVRFFNADGDAAPHKVYVGFTADSAELTGLNGHRIRPLSLQKDSDGRKYISLSMPRFGISTIKFIHAR
jgi:alpha-mannosidase